jgi:hypothetical protein
MILPMYYILLYSGVCWNIARNLCSNPYKKKRSIKIEISVTRDGDEKILHALVYYFVLLKRGCGFLKALWYSRFWISVDTRHPL